MAGETFYLVTGANRGLGKAMVATFLLRPSSTVVATVRDPSHETAKSLSTLPVATDSKLVVLPLDMKTGLDSLGQALSDAGITRLDVVISNAGTCDHFHLARDEDAESLRHAFEVNSIGPLRLFQITWPLLSSAEGGQKKFVLITSSLGSFGLIEAHSMPGAAYSAAKAAANWLARKLWVECRGEGLKVGIIHPGWFDTDMGQRLADVVGLPEPPMKIEDCTRSVVEKIDNLTQENSARFLNHDGQELPG